MLLRREDRRRSWFWASSEADELDDLEDEVERAKWGGTSTAMRVKRRRSGLKMRVLWFLLTAVRRAMMDVGMGMLVALVGAIVLGGGWRRARFTLTAFFARTKRSLGNG